MATGTRSGAWSSLFSATKTFAVIDVAIYESSPGENIASFSSFFIEHTRRTRYCWRFITLVFYLAFPRSFSIEFIRPFYFFFFFLKLGKDGFWYYPVNFVTEGVWLAVSFNSSYTLYIVLFWNWNWILIDERSIRKSLTFSITLYEVLLFFAKLFIKFRECR